MLKQYFEYTGLNKTLKFIAAIFFCFLAWLLEIFNCQCGLLYVSTVDGAFLHEQTIRVEHTIHTISYRRARLKKTALQEIWLRFSFAYFYIIWPLQTAHEELFLDLLEVSLDCQQTVGGPSFSDQRGNELSVSMCTHESSETTCKNETFFNSQLQIRGYYFNIKWLST